VRDALCHQLHRDPWLGLPDLDLVVEGVAFEVVERLPQVLAQALGMEVSFSAREHGHYGTVELMVDLPEAMGGRWLLDVASAREESYPVPAANPVVVLGCLEADLARRDFSVNAMALVLGEHGLASSVLLDLYDGSNHLKQRVLHFLHPNSLRDDPTRLLRAARYVARLGFELSPSGCEQARTTIDAWPWRWKLGDDPAKAPPALSTRLRMELELLLDREPWPVALSVLQAWGGFRLLDASLHLDSSWHRRLLRARRFGLPLLPALLATASEPMALAERLQLPHRQRQLLMQLQALRTALASQAEALGSVSAWCRLLEAPGVSADAVALALAAGVAPRRPLLRWWHRWRHIGPPVTAAALMAEEGLKPGPALGERLRQLRAERLDQLE
jgi:poly(A) polymerase